jgi:hypothetical protein
MPGVDRLDLGAFGGTAELRELADQPLLRTPTLVHAAEHSVEGGDGGDPMTGSIGRAETAGGPVG